MNGPDLFVITKHVRYDPNNHFIHSGHAVVVVTQVEEDAKAFMRHVETQTSRQFDYILHPIQFEQFYTSDHMRHPD